jgi:diguanylate cyclase (GGDEF)-like protein
VNELAAPPPLTRHRQPLRRRLQLGLTTLCLLAIVLGSAVVVVLTTTMAELRAEILRTDELEQHASDLEVALLEQQAGFRGYLLTGDGTYHTAYDRALEDQRFALDGLYQLTNEPEIIQAISLVSQTSETWREEFAVPLIAEMSGGDDAAAREGMGNVVGRRLFDDVRVSLHQLDGFLGLAHQATEQTLMGTQTLIVTIIGAALGLMALGVVLSAIWILRRLSNPLDRLVRTVEALERGEDVSFDSKRSDEIGLLAGSLERLQRTLRGRYQAAEVAAQRGRIFNRVSELISYADDEEAIVRAARAAVERLVPSRAGDLLLINPSLDRLRVVASWGSAAVVEPLAEARPNQCPAIRRSAPHLVPVSGDDLSLACKVHPVTSGSLACLPVLAHGEPVGVVHLERAASEEFDDEELRLVTRLTEQLGLALSNLRLMRKMESQAMTDPLTGLANARFFDPILERHLAAAQRDGTSVGILALDLDHFKEFNDRYGHPAGDEALRTFARVVRGNLRDSDTAARMGGEEFAVALHDTDLAGAAQVAEKLRAAIEGTAVEISPGRFARISVSIGVAASGSHGTERMALMKTADQALYAAKRAGRNAVVTPDTVVSQAMDDAPEMAVNQDPDRTLPTPIRQRSARQARLGGKGRPR